MESPIFCTAIVPPTINSHEAYKPEVVEVMPLSAQSSDFSIHPAKRQPRTSAMVSNASGNCTTITPQNEDDEEDTTPSDSGVQMVDSDLSEFMVESISSQMGFDLEDSNKLQFVQSSTNIEPMVFIAKDQQPNLILDSQGLAEKQQATEIHDHNLNDPIITCDETISGHDQELNSMKRQLQTSDLITNQSSTSENTENIVYRRKTRKNPPIIKSVSKKRVSFHEDILKNTRTDNIHIEHGFITYKTAANRKKIDREKIPVGVPGRYSWCVEGDRRVDNSDDRTLNCRGIFYHNHSNDGKLGTIVGAEIGHTETEIGTNDNSGNGNSNRSRRYLVYRNACSDVLDYGDSDVYDLKESNALQYDKSGIFEYGPNQRILENTDLTNNNNPLNSNNNNIDNENHNLTKNKREELYKCSCSSSSSSSSLNSEENADIADDAAGRQNQYAQAKSRSCDCIGNNNNNNFIGKVANYLNMDSKSIFIINLYIKLFSFK